MPSWPGPGNCQTPLAPDCPGAYSIEPQLATAANPPGCRPLRGVATYEEVYKLTYVRGPSGIIVMLAEELKKN